MDTIEAGGALDCLAAAIYYEAAGEPEEGQRAVAQVVLNRVRHPAFPTSICNVVFQGAERVTGCQFTFTCDGSLVRRPSETGWRRARRIALEALNGRVEPSVGMATHYHADRVLPYWAPSLDKLAALGHHIFYRWKGAWGRRGAFRQAYGGEALEPSRLDLVPRFAEGAEAGPLQGDDGTSGDPKLVADEGVIALAGPAPISDSSPPTLLADDHRGMLKADEALPAAGTETGVTRQHALPAIAAR